MEHNGNNVDINASGLNGEGMPSQFSCGLMDGTNSTNTTGLKKGPWTAAEDRILMEYVSKHGVGNWNSVQINSGLKRCGKSCRLRWANHLRPHLKKGAFTPEEERLILELHAKYGNKWARMASQLPGRTDNEIKNYWNTRVKRRQRQGLPLYPHDIKQSQQHSHSQSQPTTLTIPSTSTGMPPTGQTYSFQYQSSSSSHNSAFNQFYHPTDSSSSFTFHRPTPVLGAPMRYKRYRDSHHISPPASPTPQRNGSILRTSSMPDISYSHHFAPGNMSMPDMASFQQFHPPSRNFNGSLPPLPQSTSTHFTQTRQSDHQITNHNETHHCSNLLEELLQEAEALSSVATPRKPGAIHHHNHMNDSTPEDLSKLFSFIPSTEPISDWYSTDSGEFSNGDQSSGVTTEASFEFDMQQHMASLFPAVVASSSTDHHERVPNSHWDI